MKTEVQNGLYPNGVHCDISPKGNLYELAVAVHREVRDEVDTIVITKDTRVAFAATSAHGYYALATKFGHFGPGTVIGEEAEGIDREWMKALNWSSPYAP